MALYSDLPVYKSTYDLLLAIFRLTKYFGKEYKYTVDEILKKETIELLTLTAISVHWKKYDSKKKTINLTGETRKAFLNRVGTIKKYMNKASLILGAGLITAAVVAVVVISSGGDTKVDSTKVDSTKVDSTKASFKILGTWVNVNDPTDKVFFTADSFGVISAETLKYNWINEQEMDVTISTDKKARMKITIDGDNLTISFEGDESKYIREGAAGNTATTADNDPIEVTIGTQVWMTKNLNVDTFRNGDTIPEVKTKEDWEKAGNNKQPAWCYYDNDPANGEKYGKLYNWYAVNDPRGLAPKGWHIPSDEEWTALVDHLGGKTEGTKMKSTSGWQENRNDGNVINESGFSGLPGGIRVSGGPFYNIGKSGCWWSSTEEFKSTAWNHTSTAWYRGMSYEVGEVDRYYVNKGSGFCVRCLRD